jgi:sterol desaturase/sphingolipid hydroxylase (fatty acid hydroxylase superfamily)
MLVNWFKSFLEDWQGEILFSPIEASGRFYWASLLSSLLIAYLLTSKEYGFKKSFSIIQEKLFSKKIWLHPSSLLDLKLFIFNSLFKILILIPFIGLSFKLSSVFLRLLRLSFPTFEGLNIVQHWQAPLYTLIFFIINDFFRFIHHYFMHNVRLLTYFHQTHHSAKVLTPLTLMRAHPLEVLMAQLRNGLTYALTLALSVFLFPEPVQAWTLLGVGIFGMLFNLLGSNLRHSSLFISFGILEYLFISPRMHQIHHSNKSKHFNKNFGVTLSIWDLMFGTFYRPKAHEEHELKKNIEYGLDFVEINETNNLKEAIFNPIKKLTNAI